MPANLGAQVARAEYLMDLPRFQEFFELCRYVGGSMWNVQVAYTEDQHHECDVRSSSSREGQHAPGQQDEPGFA